MSQAVFDDGHHVVIGGGQAGATAIQAMREAGFAGAITLIGAEAHLPYERPSLSKEFLTSAQPHPEPVLVAPETWYRDNAISRLLGTAARIDCTTREVECADGQRVEYDKLLLTTGSIPRRLHIPGTDLDGIHYLRSLDDAQRLRQAFTTARRVVVVGGGLIGLEVAASARQSGLAVEVLEASPALLERVVPRIVSERISARHRAEGVGIHVNSSVRRILGNRAVTGVELTDGSMLEADLVVIGIGVTPAIELAEQAGIEIADGVAIDRYCRTSEPHVYAAGDCACVMDGFTGHPLHLENWTNAQNQAIAAGRNMGGDEFPYWEPPYGWTVQYDLMIQLVGTPSAWSQPIVRQGRSGGELVLQVDDGVITGAVGINSNKELAITRRLVSSRTSVDKERLADPGQSLKSILLGR